MAKISKQIKLKAILEYISGNVSKTEIARRGCKLVPETTFKRGYNKSIVA